MQTKPKYGVFDFTTDESTDSIPNKYVLEIVELEYDDAGEITGGDEIAVVIHRASEQSPIDGPEANTKREHAARIVDALNNAGKPAYGLLTPLSVRDEIHYRVTDGAESYADEITAEDAEHIEKLSDEEIDKAVRASIDDGCWGIHDMIRSDAIDQLVNEVRVNAIADQRPSGQPSKKD